MEVKTEACVRPTSPVVFVFDQHEENISSLTDAPPLVQRRWPKTDYEINSTISNMGNSRNLHHPLCFLDESSKVGAGFQHTPGMFFVGSRRSCVQQLQDGASKDKEPLKTVGFLGWRWFSF